ncbi:MAG: orotidine-5'-phosphate decarboxylase [Planctomycetota bacterium]
MTFAHDLLAAVRDKSSRVCVGIDPMPERFPEAIRPTSDDPRAIVDSFYEFTTGVLDAVADVAACVKFQSAYFERYHADGVEAYFELIGEAKQKGLLVIGDAKRGDIGATSAAYAAGHLGPHPADDADTPDALTVNPMLGLDTLDSFGEVAADHGKGLFVLVRTSNPGSADLQDVVLQDGRTWSEMLADELFKMTAGNSEDGLSFINAVVGATQPHTMASLRKRLPRSFFLLPGYGTQGGTAETAKAAFAEGTPGAIVSASRSVLYPTERSGDWKQSIAHAAQAMRRDLASVVG